MAKKLKVEVDVDAQQAKRKLNEAAPDVSGAASGASPLVHSNERLARATELNGQRMLSMTKAFTGIALGMAASYSARYFEKGSTPEKALDYGGAAISGASAGAMIGAAAGPVGATVGGLFGAAAATIQKFFDRSSATTEAIKDYESSEEDYEGNINFARDMTRITSPFNGESVSTKIATLSDQYDFYANMIAELQDAIKDALSSGELEKAQELRGFLQSARARKDTVYSLAEKLETSRTGEPVASRTAMSALQKIGGGVPSYGGHSVSDPQILARVEGKLLPETNRLLREIRDNLGIKGDSKWL